MSDIRKSYRAWVAAQVPEGCTVEVLDDDHVRFEGTAAIGEVNFYCMEPDPDIVELRVFRRGFEDDTEFFLHFELVDEERARELFVEMVDALSEHAADETTHVLLCCTSGMTTMLFAGKMNEVAETLHLNIDFVALPVDEAIVEGPKYAAVLVAPQAGYRRAELDAAMPAGLPVVEVPAKVFGSYDAGTAVRITLEALGRGFRPPGVVKADTRIVRDLDNDKKILVICAVNSVKYAEMGYRVYDHGEVVAQGMTFKRRRDIHDIDDVLASAKVDGVDTASLDAIGVALPGVVYRGSVRFSHTAAENDYDMGRRLSKRFGAKVFLDNNANAAAVGCYVTQDQYESVLLHTQQTGYLVGGQGLVVDGRLVKGRKNYAGELNAISQRMKLSMDPHAACWDAEGMLEIVANHITATCCAVSPDAVYVAVKMVPDMDALRAEMARTMQEEFIPDLIYVDDYRERIFLGELALCLQKLKSPRPHRKV